MVHKVVIYIASNTCIISVELHSYVLCHLF